MLLTLLILITLLAALLGAARLFLRLRTYDLPRAALCLIAALALPGASAAAMTRGGLPWWAWTLALASLLTPILLAASREADEGQTRDAAIWLGAALCGLAMLAMFPGAPQRSLTTLRTLSPPAPRTIRATAQAPTSGKHPGAPASANARATSTAP